MHVPHLSSRLLAPAAPRDQTIPAPFLRAFALVRSGRYRELEACFLDGCPPQGRHPGTGDTLLHVAAAAGRHVPPDQRPDAAPPRLLTAPPRGRLSIISLLLRNGVDVNATNYAGETALHAALRGHGGGAAAAPAAIAQRGARGAPGSPKRAASSVPVLPSAPAAPPAGPARRDGAVRSWAQLEAVALLLRHGANPNARDSRVSRPTAS